MKNRLLRILGAMLLLGAAGLAPAKDELVARMGSKQLSASELGALLDEAGSVPSGKPDAQVVERAARAEMIRRAVLDEAKKQGWDHKPGVQARMSRAADQALLASYMNDIARPPASYPSEQEVLDAYAASKEQLMAPRQYHLAQIYVSSQSGTGERDAERRINEVLHEARKKGADFAQLAKQYSEHKASAAQGGDMGWLPESGILPEVREAAAGLARNEIGKPVKTAQGFYLFKLLDKREPALRALAEVRDALVQALRLRRAREIEAAYLQTLIAKNPIAIDQTGLNLLASGRKQE